MKRTYEVSLASSASDFLRMEYGVDRPLVKWLLDSFEMMSTDPHVGDSSVISVELALYRTNIGEYKIIYQVQEDNSTVVILAARRRLGR